MVPKALHVKEVYMKYKEVPAMNIKENCSTYQKAQFLETTVWATNEEMSFYIEERFEIAKHLLDLKKEKKRLTFEVKSVFRDNQCKLYQVWRLSPALEASPSLRRRRHV